MRDHQLEQPAQDGGALGGGFGAPSWQGGLRGGDGAVGFGSAHVRHMAQRLAIARIPHRDLPAAIGIHPLARDEALLPDKIRIAHG